MFTATTYLSKYRDVLLDSWLCSAPNTAKLDLTAPAPIALNNKQEKYSMQVPDKYTYVQMSVPRMAGAHFSIVILFASSIGKLQKVFPSTVVVTNAYPAKYKTKPISENVI